MLMVNTYAEWERDSKQLSQIKDCEVSAILGILMEQWSSSCVACEQMK